MSRVHKCLRLAWKIMLACASFYCIVTSARLYRSPQGDHMFQVGESFYCFIYIYIISHDLESAPACMCAAQAPMPNCISCMSQQGLLATYLVLGRDGRGVRLGSESSSGAGAGGGVSKFGSSKSGNLRNWTSRDLGSKPSTKLELQNQNPCAPINQGVPLGSLPPRRIIPHIASRGILQKQQCSCHPGTQGCNLVCYPPRVDRSRGPQPV